MTWGEPGRWGRSAWSAVPLRDASWPVRVTGVIALLGALAQALPMPANVTRGMSSTVSMAVSTVFITLAVRQLPPGRRDAFRIIHLGCLTWLAAWALFVYYRIHDPQMFPSPGDAVFVVAYVPLVVGVLMLNRQRSGRLAFGPLLDASIVTVSAGVLTVAFIVLPTVRNTGMTVTARLFGSVYPLLDVLLLFLVAQMLVVRATRDPARWWLTAGIVTTLVADILQNVIVLRGGHDFPGWMFVLWALLFVGIGVAADCAGQEARKVTAPGPVSAAEADAGGGLTVARLVVLTATAGLPSLVLLLTSRNRADSYEGYLSAGSLLLLVMVTFRIWDLLRVLKRQAVRLSEVARTDPLTGVANRRSWDFELARGLAAATRTGPVLLTGLLDLDHFKKYNDEHGHQAGDDLLREAAQTWRRALGTDGYIARWGGEEFAILVRCDDEADGLLAIDALRGIVPSGQTCSIGAARWDGQEDAEALLHRVDEALYEAKHAGRNRLVRSSPVLESVPEDHTSSISSITRVGES
ncbi:GGDEF domain-containing protein [Kineosporia mesophila]|uniref:GGDEF domain-containing protein n=1 Tax=Kineosporia mesophila TaxID=566012 RepID=UPI001E2EC3F0|nr:GGDEF domain-containing protein [Kineosporia mesophila]